MPDSVLYWIAQVLGFMGTVTIVIGMQQKKYKHIALCKIGNEFLSGIHYLLLGGYTGMVANLISCATNGVYYFRIKKSRQQGNACCLLVLLGFFLFFFVNRAGAAFHHAVPAQYSFDGAEEASAVKQKA